MGKDISVTEEEELGVAGLWSKTQDKIWLVKSAGVILGPYTSDEMVEALKQRHVTIIDEVRDPKTRWSFIREHAQFAQVVQALREQQIHAREITSTDIATDPHVTSPMIESENFSEEISTEKKTERQTEKVADNKHKVPTYAFGGSTKARQRSYALWAWMFCASVIVFAGLAYRHFHHEAVPSLGFDDCVRLAKYNQELGIYDRALEYYQKAEAIQPLSVTLRTQRAFLLMVVEDQNMAARQIFESLQAKTPSDELDRMVALSYLREGRWQEAQKRFEVLVQKNPQDEVSQENLLMAQILEGDFQNVYNKLSAMFRAGIKDPLLIVYQSVIAYRLFDPAKDRQKLHSALEDLQRYASDYQDYKLEVMLLMAGLENALGDEAAVDENLKKMMAEFPDLTRDHIHREKIDREILKWPYLSNICDLLVQKKSQTATSMGLQSYCAYQRSDLKTALDLIEKARNQYSADNSLVGLHAFLLMKSGRDEEAKALFQLPLAKENKLVWAVHGSVCEKQKDWACADESWNGLLTRDEKNLEALRGMAVLSLNRGQREMASDLIKRGLLISENYRPLVTLKEQVDAH